jgi:16S rRNA (uracil1498-N3)-methyltransferase
MTTARLYLPSCARHDDTIEITGTELRHLRVLRLRPGAELLVFDGSGREYLVRLTSIERQRAVAHVVTVRTSRRESALELVLAPAILKGARMDHVFEKATELGVTRFAPLVTERVQGRPDLRERWMRIVVAAAKQSGRTCIPAIEPPRTVAPLLAAYDGHLAIVAWEQETRTRMADLPDAAGNVLAMTGPEGGFTESEITTALSLGARTIGIGPRVLRAETAAIVLAAIAQHRWGDG